MLLLPMFDETETNNSSGVEVIIVGAGVAGSALAYALGKDGRRVHVIERDLTEPDRMVGELLQPGGYLKLIELGLEDCVENIDAQKVYGYVVLNDGKTTTLSYPLEKFPAKVSGRCFRNGRFIQRMRRKAASLPAVQIEQGTVTSLVEENGIIKGVQYKNKNSKETSAYAPLTIVCDGCFSNLRRSLCKPMIDIPSCLVGLTIEKCSLPFANYGLLILGNSSSVLLYQNSSEEVRCFVDMPAGRKVPSVSNGELANYLKTVVTPQIPLETRGAFVMAVNKGNIKIMQNKSMSDSYLPTPGALLLGDALNMRHPLTGGGMTVALSDIVVLRNLLRPLKNLNDAYKSCKYLESFYTLRKPLSSTINTLAGASYEVLCASPDQVRNEMRKAFLGYLSLGGSCCSVPMSLISGLNPRPWTVLLYFLVVAVYAVGSLLLPFPSPKRVLIAAKLIYNAAAIIFPIIKAEGVRKMLFPTTMPSFYRAPPAQS